MNIDGWGGIILYHKRERKVRMSKIIFLFVMMLLSLTIMVIGVNFKPNENTRNFFMKKIVDMVVIVVNYLVLIALYSLLLDDKAVISEKTIMSLIKVNILSSCFNFCVLGVQIPFFKKNIRSIHGKADKAMIISIAVGLFFTMAEIYFSLFMFNSDWFVIDEAIANNALRAAFEFIYYTFSVTITYSGSGIEVVGTVPKVVQMMHVLFFYIFAGDAILQLIKKE